MGAFQRERRVHPRRTRVCSWRGVRYTHARLLSRGRIDPPAAAASTDGRIRLINISVDSGPDSCRDEKLTKFRVTKEGRKEGRRGTECVLRKFRNSSSTSTKTLRNGIEDIDVVCVSQNVRMYWNLMQFCPNFFVFIDLAFIMNIILS